MQNRLSISQSQEVELAGQIASLQTSLAERKAEIAKIPLNEKELARLNREQEIRGTRYTELKTLAETRAARHGHRQHGHGHRVREPR